jgi:hypothetical protein
MMPYAYWQSNKSADPDLIGTDKAIKTYWNFYKTHLKDAEKEKNYLHIRDEVCKWLDKKGTRWRTQDTTGIIKELLKFFVDDDPDVELSFRSKARTYLAEDYDNIGRINIGWGICGFAAALEVAYNKDPQVKKEIDKDNAAKSVETKLLNKILEFLLYLRDGDLRNGIHPRHDILNEIQNFTNLILSPQDKAVVKNTMKEFNWNTLITRLTNVKSTIKDTALHGQLMKVYLGGAPYGNISMYPDALVAFLKFSKIKSAYTTDVHLKNYVKGPSKQSSILGVGINDNNPKTYYGLQHWVYQDTSGTIHSYGEAFPGENVSIWKNWRVLHYIHGF